jgi:AraC family transcriptional regulator
VSRSPSALGRPGAFGDRLGDCFHVGSAPAFVTRGLHVGDIAVTRILCDRTDNGLTNPIPREDALLVAVQMRDCPRHDLWIDGRPRVTGPLPAGVTCIYDLRTSPIAYSIDPFETLHFYFPAKVLDAIADEEGWGPVRGFWHEPGLGLLDPVAHNLALSLMPTFQGRHAVTALYVDHVVTAMAGYAARFGRRTSRRFLSRGLTTEQERRAKELLVAHSDGDLTIATLAAACGLPPSAFRRGFFRSTGRLPSQWLEDYRRQAGVLLTC